MKISRKHPHLAVFSPLYPPHVGGLESHAQQFNRELGKHGWQISVFTPLVTRHTKLFEQEGTVRIFRFPAWEIIPNYPVPKLWQPLFWRQLYRALSPRPHILISRTRFFLTSIIALIVSKLLRIKWIHIEHGSDFVHLHSRWSSVAARVYDHTLGRAALWSADAIIANSRASAKFVQRLAPHRTTHVIYRGIDAAALELVNANDAFRKQKPTRFIVTYVGRLIDGKGVADLLHAIAAVQNPSIFCLIIGDGPQRKNLINLAQTLQIHDRVEFLGEISWIDAISYMKISDVIVNPSYTEGLPTVMLEAILCRRAVIGTNVGGTPEIITDGFNGYLVAPGDIASLAQRLEQLSSDPRLRQQLAAAGYNAISRSFAWDKSLAQYEELFQSL